MANILVVEDEQDLLQVMSGEWDLGAEQVQWITGRTAEQLWFQPHALGS